MRYASVLGRRMAYREVGAGEPIVVLHGNPTSAARFLVARARPGAAWPDPGAAWRREPGEQLVLVANVFVEKVLPASTIRTLAAEEMDAYRAPYRAPGESRRPTLTWPREIPIDGEPADVAEIVSGNAAWMASSQVPKLFVNGEPGALLTGPLRERCRQWPNQREVTVPGLHFLPEDSGAAIAEALRVWLPRLPVSG